MVNDKLTKFDHDDNKENNSNNNDNDLEPSEVLKEWKLYKYADILIVDLGYEDVEDWKLLTKDELMNEIGMKKGHAMKFMRKAAEL